MLTKITTLIALHMWHAEAVITPGTTIGGTAGAPTGYPKAVTVISSVPATNLLVGGYDCIRQGLFWNFPGTNGAGSPPTALAVATSNSILSYYPTIPS